jgi:cytochrome b6-f complex iron-sulfur subunit
MGKRRRKKEAKQKKPSADEGEPTPGRPTPEEILAEEEAADAAREALLGRGDPDAEPLSSRRQFLVRAGNWTVFACALGAAAGSVRLAAPDFFEGPPERFPLGLPSDFKTGTLTWLQDKQIFVLRDGGGFAAFSSRCTHLGCTVRRTADGFFCPCHGARYDEKGRVIAGPAREPLPWFEVWAEPDGRIWIDTGKRVPPGTLTPLGGVDS